MIANHRRLIARIALGATALLAAPTLHATNLGLRLRSGGSSSIQVAPGQIVNWELVGELSDTASEGLALFSVDLSWNGGALAPAATPVAAPMTSFAVPAGLNNPQGFGGVVVASGLRQVGGAQNTLNNSFGPYPVGSVTTGVAELGAPQTLVSGQLTAPLTPGTYTLSVSRLVANVLAPGAGGVPVWKVEPAPPGTLVPLTVQVQTPVRGRPARRPKGARP